MDTSTIIYFKHGLGNLIMMSPAIISLASMDKSGMVDIWLSSDWNDSRRSAFDDYFDKWDIIQDVINYPDSDFVKKYKRWFYTGHAEHSDAFNVFRKKCKISIEAPNWRMNGTHEVYWYMDSVYNLGYKGNVPNQYVPVSDKPVLKSRRPLIGLCNGTYSQRMKTAKQWAYFNELVETLRGYYNPTIVKIGYQEELKDVKCDIDYVNKLSITETAFVISQLDLLITTDTANMHIGDAFGIPMVVIFGGTLISKNGPLGKNAECVALGLDCQPCQRTHSFYNCEHYKCINELKVGDVMAAVRRRLSE